MFRFKILLENKGNYFKVANLKLRIWKKKKFTVNTVNITTTIAEKIKNTVEVRYCAMKQIVVVRAQKISITNGT